MGVETENKKDWIAYIKEKWGARNSYCYSDSVEAYRTAFIAMGVQKGDYVLLSALAQAAAVQAALSLEAKILFVDVQAENAQLDLEVLENFLSLATIVNEHNELIYRKDNACIRCIVLDHPFGRISDVQKVLFTAMRYQLKVLEDFTEALGRELVAPIGRSGHLSLVQLAQASLVLDIPTPDIFRLASFGTLEEVNIQEQPNQDCGSLKAELSLVYPQNTEILKSLQALPNTEAWEHNEKAIRPVIFPKQAAALRAHLAAKQLIPIAELEERVELLKKHTFLNKSKIAFRFLMETVILPANPEEQTRMLKAINQFIHDN